MEILGTPDEGEKNRLSPKDCRNILTRGKKEGHSKLTFLANNGNVYRAEWYVKFKTKNYDDAILSLYKLTSNKGQTVEEEADWNELPTIIGLDYDQFLRTVLIAQGSFANFLTASEDDRYQLLEKLIGNEEIYTNIATRISKEKEEATRAFDEINAYFAAVDKDIIKDQKELDDLTTRIAKLDEEDRNAKTELGEIAESLGWYATEENFEKNIPLYEGKLSDARNKLNEIKADAERLALHDLTIEAVKLYDNTEKKQKEIEGNETQLVSLNKKVTRKKEEIEKENSNLEKLKEEANKANQTLEQQKPHINKARTMKGELESANKTVEEKQTAKSNAEGALSKAKQAVDDNATAIRKGEDMLQDAKGALQKLKSELQKKADQLNEAAEKGKKALENEQKKIEGKDSDTLQKAKETAEKKKTDLNEAIRIRKGIENDTVTICNLEKKNKELEERNKEIEDDLKKFNTESLTKEIETLRKTYTLMTCENWREHRATLQDGEACPLCGSTHHPYESGETFEPVAHELEELISSKGNLLKEQNDEKLRLSNEKSQNAGVLKANKMTIANTKEALRNLENEWTAIYAQHTDWPLESDRLEKLKPSVEQNAIDASNALKEYNKADKEVNRLRKAKEKAENDVIKFKDESDRLIKEAEKKQNDCSTALQTEKGKTANLKEQQSEKEKNLSDAANALWKANEELEAKRQAIKKEIGDNDPDALEQSLTTAKDKADQAVTDKTKTISNLNADLKELSGKIESTNQTKADNISKRDASVHALNEWLASYNADESHQQKLAVEDIASLAKAKDNWEDIRSCQKKRADALTSAETTLKNETKAHTEHQQKKPEATKDVLAARKTQLESRSNAELVEAKARMQRHEEAKRQMGTMFEKKQEAETFMKEWKEISDSVGSDGKTLRKVAQCYTLHFLIAHANVEIRKFNSRYELKQVKNSLGIRVIDHDRADDIRDTTSLSGGETFIVSLGLALGLSALSSRNISFENLFIDEGFGTLDPDTLSTVIDSLAMLQTSQGKKVGVISHTYTMSERITTQIRIIKNGNSGSSHIEIYP
ncbi:MAG: hypothetical protein K5683_03365 [Prevotella sp.]|nr:hypothetical protein [Prevotella sp.]